METSWCFCNDKVVYLIFSVHIIKMHKILLRRPQICIPVIEIEFDKKKMSSYVVVGSMQPNTAPSRS